MELLDVLMKGNTENGRAAMKKFEEEHPDLVSHSKIVERNLQIQELLKMFAEALAIAVDLLPQEKRIKYTFSIADYRDGFNANQFEIDKMKLHILKELVKKGEP